jgi:hypothetical protein
MKKIFAASNHIFVYQTDVHKDHIMEAIMIECQGYAWKFEFYNDDKYLGVILI